MELHTKAGDIVLEPFCGSGSQIIAAEKLGRRCRAMEIQPAFVDVAVRRWEAATKGTATLDATGATFAEVAAERGRIEPDPAPDRR
jgi:DNA modification methylase